MQPLRGLSSAVTLQVFPANECRQLEWFPGRVLEEGKKVYNFPLSVGVYFSLLVGAPDTMITVSTINGNRSYEHVSHKKKEHGTFGKEELSSSSVATRD